MKFVICMDAWKGSLSARSACEAVAQGIHAVLPHAETLCCPMADGGEGTMGVVAAQRPGQRISLEVTGPFPDRRVQADYLYWADAGEAFVEMAVCAGLPLLAEDERDPLRTTTRGVGELMADAMQRGAKKIFLAVGGSATVDGGTGMAAALGWQFLDASGRPLPEGGGALAQLDRIVPVSAGRAFPELDVLCDVTNPLLGARGAARVFAPQKGANPEAVEDLEAGLARFAACCQRDLGKSIATLPGGGAAGGIAAGAVALLGGRLVSGVDAVMDMIGLSPKLSDADWVITGEGRFDDQSLEGKVVSGVLRRAQAQGVPVAVVAGSCGLDAAAMASSGIWYAEAANNQGLPLAQAMREAEALAADAGARLAQRITGECGPDHG